MPARTIRKDLSVPPGFTRPKGPLIFSKESIFENYCSANHAPAMLEVQAETLLENLMAKRAELIKNAVRKHMGKKVIANDVKTCLHVVKFDGDAAELSWLFIDKEAVCVFSDPKSRTEGNKYFLRFNFIELSASLN